MATSDRVARICRQTLDDRTLRIALLDEIRRAAPFDHHAWLLTDPETAVGSAPLAEVPSLAELPRLIRAKYLTTVARWTSLPADAPTTTLAAATGGMLGRSRLWSEGLAAHGIEDVMSTVFRDRFGCWGFLDLWRRAGTFSVEEVGLVTTLVPAITAALRGSLRSTLALTAPQHDVAEGPVVLLLDDDLQGLTQTPGADAYLRALLPTDADRAPIPAGAYNVAAQLLAQEAGVDPGTPSARVHLRGGLWVTLRAARMIEAGGGGPSIAVSIERTPPEPRAGLYARVIGLSEREAELLGLLVAGRDTGEIAARMIVSEHTVQDHLKSIFGKAGVRTRRVLVARATGVA